MEKKNNKLVIVILICLIFADVTVFSIIGIFKIKINDIENQFLIQLQTVDVEIGVPNEQTTDNQDLEESENSIAKNSTN